MDYAAILEAANSLSREDRIRLVEAIWQSIEVDAAWRFAITRRREEMRSGKVVGIPGDQVLAELREEFP